MGPMSKKPGDMAVVHFLDDFQPVFGEEVWLFSSNYLAIYCSEGEQ